MNIRQALSYNTKIETDLLLGFVLRKSKEYLYMHPEQKLTSLQEQKFRTACKARAKGKPIAYITGSKSFYGRHFIVTPDTLIPRPETEQLIDLVLNEILPNLTAVKKGSNPPSVSVLDMGTGSGCIAITLAKELQFSPPQRGGVPAQQAGWYEYNITATDISLKALAVARKNARRHETFIKFITSDLFQNIKGQFNLIIANLPYVPKSDYIKLKQSLKHEPKLALTDNTDTWHLYEQFLKQVNHHLTPRGTIVFEIDPKATKYLRSYTKTYLPHHDIAFIQDAYHRTRFAIVHSL